MITRCNYLMDYLREFVPREEVIHFLSELRKLLISSLEDAYLAGSADGFT